MKRWPSRSDGFNAKFERIERGGEKANDRSRVRGEVTGDSRERESECVEDWLCEKMQSVQASKEIQMDSDAVVAIKDMG